jgi:putative membrane protein
MKLIIALVATCVGFSTQAFAQTLSAQEFVDKVAISDMFEVQSSRLAAAQKADKTTTEFANLMIKDHSKTTQELKALASKLKLKLPTSLDPEHQKKIDQLKGLSGDQLDDTYDRMQVEAHEEAIKLFEGYAQNGDNAELKAWAAKTLPALKEHLAHAQKLK